MQIATVGDAMSALQQVNADLITTTNNISAASSSSYFSWLIPGNSELATTAYSVVSELNNFVGRILSELNGIDYSTPLTAQQTAEMKELQTEVISDRKEIQQSISAVDWTFGGIFDDAATIIENTASQAVTGVSSALGINWTAIAIVGAVILALYLGLLRRA